MSNIRNITSAECLQKLKDNENAHLVDVRTPEEFKIDGFSDLSSVNKTLHKITIVKSDGAPNPTFLSEFNDLKLNKDSEIYFICRSGARSMRAAALVSDFGYKNLYNVEDGFTLGWKPAGLPSCY
tara:strand:+ start:217 stop:591 length:375 start_codon:yes stop_codon:yes gene_type:complete